MAGSGDFRRLPCGHRAVYLPETPSTNAHAMRLAIGGERPPLWVWAGRQTKGRGRLGRSWDSPEGNLHASLLVDPPANTTVIGGLPLMAGLAARDAIAAVAEGAPVPERLRLKWPNDVMVDGAKLGGVLIESLVMDDGSRLAVIGTGLNLGAAPAVAGRSITCLCEYGVAVTPAEMLAALAEATARWLDVWAGGTGFAEIRGAWLHHADPLGAPISVTLGSEQFTGRFGGLDETGALRLRVGDGERRFAAGDVVAGWTAPDMQITKAEHE
jgi:BirA family biotin operon repressor/biotin-[acetyl-CoA-carboxylase] ligase